MARARNIKPGFFKNELLVELPFEFRLLFIGLWTMADRAGRLEDRPTKVRMELFPADSVDVDAGLQSLHDAGFVERYQANGKRYVQILAWAKHQNPHKKEAESCIPSPEEALVKQGPVITGQAPEIPGRVPHRAIASPADSLIPDSLIPEKEQGAQKPAPKPRGKRFQDWIDSLNGEMAIPADDPVYRWGDQTGIPDDFLELAWLAFEDRYRQEPKRYDDWRKVFRNAVKGNWMKVWYATPDGSYALTTVGETWRRATASRRAG